MRVSYRFNWFLYVVEKPQARTVYYKNLREVIRVNLVLQSKPQLRSPDLDRYG